MLSSLLLPCSRCISLLGISSNRKQVRQIHAQMIVNSMFTSPSTVAKLIEQYISAGTPEDSLKLFARAVSRDKFTYIHTFRACARLGDLQEGTQAHAQVVKSGLASDLAIQTTAINFYSNCRDIQSARNLFDEMPDRNFVSWNAMLAGYCANGAAKETFSLLRDMLSQRIKPTERTAIALLSACSQLEDLNLGSATHAFVYKFAPVQQDCFIGTELIDMYAKCGSLENASQVFDEMSDRNVLTWTVMLSGLARHGKGKEALKMMDEMQWKGILPNEVTFTCVLSACCHAGLLVEGVQIFKAIKQRFGLEPAMQHYGCIVDLLGRAGLVEEAREVVKTMPIEPDLVVWRALLSACKVHRRVEIGEEVGKRLLQLEKARKKATDGGRSCEDFVAMSNVYASAERWEEVAMVRKLMKSMRLQNKAGRSTVQIA
nr:pentatricopeptide repeat protein AaPPR1206 [Agave angustifolia]